MTAPLQPGKPALKVGAVASGSKRDQILGTARLCRERLDCARSYLKLAVEDAREIGLLLLQERVWLGKAKRQHRKGPNSKKPGWGLGKGALIDAADKLLREAPKIQNDWGVYFAIVLASGITRAEAKRFEKLARIPRRDPNAFRRAIIALDLVPRKVFPKQEGDATAPRVGAHLACENRLSAFVRELDSKTQGELSPAVAAHLLDSMATHVRFVDRLRDALKQS